MHNNNLPQVPCSMCGEMTSLIKPCSCMKDRMEQWKLPHTTLDNPLGFEFNNTERLKKAIDSIEKMRKEQHAKNKAEQIAKNIEEATNELREEQRKSANSTFKKLITEHQLDNTYDRIVEEQSAKEYEATKKAIGEDDCPGRSSVKCNKCGKCHSVFKDCVGSDFPSLEENSVITTIVGKHDDKVESVGWSDYDTVPNDDTWVNYLDIGVKNSKNKPLVELYNELGNLGWHEDSEGWNEAIAAVRQTIRDRMVK